MDHITTGMVDLDSADDVALADKMNAGRKQIIAELEKRIVGQKDVVELVLMTLFVGGNSLIVGVPGLAKTICPPTRSCARSRSSGAISSVASRRCDC